MNFHIVLTMTVKYERLVIKSHKKTMTFEKMQDLLLLDGDANPEVYPPTALSITTKHTHLEFIADARGRTFVSSYYSEYHFLKLK